ncbi:shikimate 5-dehydrogenase [Geobacter metallireducens RCH3]|uniref:Shikimate dehydrogenase (NADP(+)) n=1 Tax=Geobacter metallireducens (strain ATCC 53774 / DSM 7210 / GS-15) TaxID=269799 RepID=AROE_GEOMG|nr:shikimate dehydrogenase [Geobacter metallireducens]Q39VU8.1 RecName: Full=Shikimate dehydrogenase (NADP(+)); Short=SDH [Geobacter metallireducens GS-15]ABB31626.1 shikimate 5-dehydrogenase [Geobacter metallireducens GS-15]EHP86613.1 shikimate 5-dehydrogenase [Geobacter metallireducens RCH3]
MDITGKTRVLGIIGWPVAHSLSPLMQNAALEAMGLDWIYVPFAVRPEDLASAVAGLRTLGVSGFNVTIPHKTAIIPLLDRITPEARLMGAVNTVKREGDDLVGYNTDGEGFIRSLAEDLGFVPAGRRILVLGAGGAARAAVASLARGGAATVMIANRSVARGEELVEAFQGVFGGTQFAAMPLDIPLINAEVQNFDLLVNTTSVGMGETAFEGLDISRMNPAASVYDMVYAPWETPLLAEASRGGRRCANGIGMLVAQGECALAIWTGMEPPPGIMRRRVLAALKR